MDPVVIKACLNGARGRDKNPHVPWTPAEVESLPCLRIMTNVAS